MHVPRLIRKVRKETRARLRPGQAVFAVSRTARYLVDTFSEQIDALPHRAQWECCRGCTYCCHYPAGVFGLEAIHIAAELSGKLDVGGRTAVIGGLEAMGALAQGQSWETRFARRHACLLLVEGQGCGIYASRPLACRSLFSSSIHACKRAFEDSSQSFQVPVDPVPVAVAGAVVAGMSLAFRDLGIPIRRYELHSALLSALREERAAERWRSGEDLFEGCCQDGGFDPEAYSQVLKQLEATLSGRGG